eukprot:CAMPEP_0181114028 /NCGR_PEP_ID=MMETSP1071-20121207/20659_1 /TAXON_ID=35127 /ORGANISM="Thalassiosira sp., Strain NH16" /LENGTH=589 /DNA_ID=CAMNT_0023198099 /DNA_START=33 /DNA_END=1802 /DNA_ORIENTATION=-
MSSLSAKTNYGSVPSIDNESSNTTTDGAAGECDGRRWVGEKRPTRQSAWTAAPLLLGLVFLATLLTTRPQPFPTLLKSSMNDAAHDEDTALFYEDQLLDHVDTSGSDEVWKHRYYKSTEYFRGPGSPIFLVVGGEGALNNGMLYPFVTQHLAKRFGAAVVQPEHRFYGPYQPIPFGEASTSQLLKLLTPEQAMQDMLRLVTVHMHEKGQDFEGCPPDRSDPDYCPLITIGASYPGFLSAMFRTVYPDVVDAAYASSAPLLMYAQVSDSDAYYDIVTKAAERSSPGCAHSVRTTLTEVRDMVLEAPSLADAAELVGVCTEGEMFPKSITSQNDLADALVLMAVYGFANYDMGVYPPGPHTSMYKICQAFQDPELDSIDTLKWYFKSQIMANYEEEYDCDMKSVHCNPDDEMAYVKEQYGECFDLRPEMDDSPEPILSEFDGISYDDGFSWNFQTCTDVIFLAGQSQTSMFVPKEATYEDLTKMCQDEFGTDVTPRPWELVDRWHFDDLVGDEVNASRILFTNGMQDMWSGGSYLEDLSDSVLALNFENGAHHSDLTHAGPSEKDTDDIREGHAKITEILGMWIGEIKEGK